MGYCKLFVFILLVQSSVAERPGVVISNKLVAKDKAKVTDVADDSIVEAAMKEIHTVEEGGTEVEVELVANDKAKVTDVADDSVVEAAMKEIQAVEEGTEVELANPCPKGKTESKFGGCVTMRKSGDGDVEKKKAEAAQKEFGRLVKKHRGNTKKAEREFMKAQTQLRLRGLPSYSDVDFKRMLKDLTYAKGAVGVYTKKCEAAAKKTCPGACRTYCMAVAPAEPGVHKRAKICDRKCDDKKKSPCVVASVISLVGKGTLADKKADMARLSPSALPDQKFVDALTALLTDQTVACIFQMTHNNKRAENAEGYPNNDWCNDVKTPSWTERKEGSVTDVYRKRYHKDPKLHEDTKCQTYL